MGALAQYEPLTCGFDFVQADASEVWRSLPVFLAEFRLPADSAERSRYEPRTIGAASLETVLKFLLPPVRNMATRYLVLSCRKVGWCAVLNNHALARSDPGLSRWLSNRFGATTIGVYCLEPKPLKDGHRSPGSLAGAGLYVHDRGVLQRSLDCVDENGRWRFEQYGQPLAFEQPERYKSRSKKERFTPQLLKEYLVHMSLSPFEDDFFVVTSHSPGLGVDFQTDDPDVRRWMSEVTLAELRGD